MNRNFHVIKTKPRLETEADSHWRLLVLYRIDAYYAYTCKFKEHLGLYK